MLGAGVPKVDVGDFLWTQQMCINVQLYLKIALVELSLVYLSINDLDLIPRSYWC